MRRLSRGALSLVLMMLAACEVATVDVLAPRCAEPADGGLTCDPTIWPNQKSAANSDPWLSAHHDSLRALRPRLMVLDFFNRIPVQQARAIVAAEIAAIAEGSRYHGYADPSVPAFVNYQVATFIDLTDPGPPADWPHPSSTLVPIRNDNFDVQALFGPEFAARYGYADPAVPGRFLTLCELFETGALNEVWVMTGDVEGRTPVLLRERKQVYDEAGAPVPGLFERCSGPACFEPDEGATCRVTVRLGAVNPLRGPGCDLQAYGFNLELLPRAIPYLRRNAIPFFNFDLVSRLGLRHADWDAMCGDSSAEPCVSFVHANAVQGAYADGTPWSVTALDQGCGSTHFPPNGRFPFDWRNPAPAVARCEHYGLRDGAGGRDQTELYTPDKIVAADRQVADCGGGWQVYWRQNMPGLDNRAYDTDGAPMKNWWQFLFY